MTAMGANQISGSIRRGRGAATLLRLLLATSAMLAGMQILAPSAVAQTNRGDDSEITVFGRGTSNNVKEVPQAVNVLGHEMIEATGSISYSDILRFVPSASNQLSEFTIAPNYAIRGFASSQTWNGMVIRSVNQDVDLANIERLEVLKGPASVLYGSMEPGAAVNLVTKLPLDRPHASATYEGGSYGLNHALVDIGAPISDVVGVRLNASYLSKGAQYDHWDLDKRFVSGVAKFDFTPTTSLILDGAYSRSKWPGVYDGRLPSKGTVLVNPLGQISRSFNPAWEPTTDSVFESVDTSARFTQALGSDFSLNAAASYHHDFRNRKDIFPGTLAANNRTLSRTIFIADGDTGNDYSGHVDVRGTIETGPFTHHATAGFDYRRLKTYARDGSGTITSIDIYAPVYGTFTFPNIAAQPLPIVSARLQTKEWFIQDRIDVLSWLHLLGGGRFTDYYNKSVSTPFGSAVGTPTIIDTTAVSSQFGIVADATSSLSFYASRNTSFVPRTGNGGVGIVDPERGTQYEGGAKLDIAGMTANASVFYIEKPNVLTVDSLNPSILTPLGAVESEGVELSIEGHPLPNWLVFAGYGYTKTKVTKANEAGLQGKQLRNAPKNTVSLVSNYVFEDGPLAGLNLSGSVQYMGSRFADTGNVLVVPSYYRLDLGVGYKINEHVDVNLFLNNVNNADIYTGFLATTVSVNNGRTVMGRVHVQF